VLWPYAALRSTVRAFVLSAGRREAVCARLDCAAALIGGVTIVGPTVSAGVRRVPGPKCRPSDGMLWVVRGWSAIVKVSQSLRRRKVVREAKIGPGCGPTSKGDKTFL